MSVTGPTKNRPLKSSSTPKCDIQLDSTLILDPNAVVAKTGGKVSKMVRLFFRHAFTTRTAHVAVTSS